MSDTDQNLTYLGLLRLPGALAAFTASTLVRLAYTTLGLALLLLVERQTGSFATAGGAVGLLSLTSVAMPLKARLIDRVGLCVVLTTLGLGLAAALAGLAALGWSGVSSSPAYLALSGVAGLLSPPVGPVMRSLWATLTPRAPDRGRAYSLDAVSEESLFVLGPLLATGIALASSPAAALLVCAAFMGVGSVWLARSRPGAGEQSSATVWGDLLGPLRVPGVRWLMLGMLAVGVALAAVEIGVVARAAESGRPASAGVLLAALSLASVVGGLAWGRLSRPGGRSTLLGLLILMTVGVALAALLPGRPLLLAALVLIGLVLAPSFVVTYVMADDLVREGVRTETNTWLGTAHNLGHAAGASLAGVLVQGASATAGLLAGAVVLAAALVVLSIRS